MLCPPRRMVNTSVHASSDSFTSRPTQHSPRRSPASEVNWPTLCASSGFRLADPGRVMNSQNYGTFAETLPEPPE